MQFSEGQQRYGAIGLCLLWCFVLIVYRTYLAFDGLTLGLLWNLFLAALPLAFSAGLRTAVARGNRIGAGLAFGLWLLFFPNAPYLLTDLIHLGPRPVVPLWFLLTIFVSCAGTGTLMGFVSLREVQVVVERVRGLRVGWAVVVGSLLLCGYGMYLGRFLRWNSWDLFTRPWALLKSMLGQFVDAGPFPHPVPVTLVFSAGLLIGYIAWRKV